MVYFITLRPTNCKKNRDIKKLVRPIKRALHSCNYAAELHPTNKDRKRDLHLHILIEANNIEYFKNRLRYFLGDWGIVYVQPAHTPRKALSYMSRQSDAEPICYKGNLAALCEI